MKKVGVWPGDGSGQGGCEQRIEVIVKMQKQKSGGPCVGWGGQFGCERRNEVIKEMQKRQGVSRGGMVRVDVNEELKLL